MYGSLKAHSKEFHLYLFAFDDLSYKILNELGLKNVTTVSLQEFETIELLEAKKTRSKGEYCWTCTPSVISYVLDKYKVPSCTYLDSDLIFYSDPSVLIEEMISNRKNVLITEHRFSALPKLHGQKRAGKFCVQFITFMNESDSLKVLDKWRNQCIEWCYARYEEGKFGDQKYLDEWPMLYSNVHILQHIGGGVAPWNIQQYIFNLNGKSITGQIKNTGLTFNLVFYHFQYVKFLKNNVYDIGWYIITPAVKKLFYKPYLKKLEEIEVRLKTLDASYQRRSSGFNKGNLKNVIKTLFKKVFKYNLIKTS